MATRRKAKAQPRKRRDTKPSKTDHRVEESSENPTSLLTLPPELRNQIYELVLIAPEKEIVVARDSKPPGLLSVNRQVRSESKQIWYFENMFVFLIDRCDAKVFGLFMDLIGPIQAASNKKVTTSSSIDNSDANWDNLIDWCRVVHKTGTAMIPTPGDDEYLTVIAAAHEIATAHHDSSWEMCLGSLTPLRRVAGKINLQWLED